MDEPPPAPTPEERQLPVVASTGHEPHRRNVLASPHQSDEDHMPTSKSKRRAAPKRAKARRRRPAAKRAKRIDALTATVRGADHRYVGHVRLDVGRAGGARVKRMIYPPGFHWARDMKPVTGTDLCMHAHVGFSRAERFTSNTRTAASSNTRRPRLSRSSQATTAGLSARSPS